MDLHKITHEIYEAAKHWHLPFLVGVFGSIRVNHRINLQSNISDLGGIPGDNILPKEILISLSSRRSL